MQTKFECIVFLRIPCRERPASPTNAPASIYLSTPLHPLTNAFSPARSPTSCLPLPTSAPPSCSPTMLLSSPCLPLPTSARLHARLPLASFPLPALIRLISRFTSRAPEGPPSPPIASENRVINHGTLPRNPRGDSKNQNSQSPGRYRGLGSKIAYTGLALIC